MDQVNEVKEKIDIVEYINARVSLKKSGRNFKALCPFHSEKTPSFYVNPDRQIWYCFGACDEGGDVLSFVQKYEGLEFVEALRELAQEAGVRLDQKGLGNEKTRIKDEIYAVNHLASEYYHYLLMGHKVGKQALDYLTKRGIKAKTIKTFKLGYAPDAWEGLFRFLSKKGYRDKLLEEAGLVIRSDKKQGYYDRFRGRVIFPLQDVRGNILGFSGRVLSGDEGANLADAKSYGVAKYINTPETAVYHKRQTLFNIYLTKQAIQRADEVIVCEGEFDVISSFQAGVSNIVAVKGSGLADEQLKLLKRFASKIIFALDSDKAGLDAVRRGVLLADEFGFDVRVAELLEGKDPDELIRNDIVLWKKTVSKPRVYFDFILDQAVRRHGTSSARAKQTIVSELAPFFARTDNVILQDHYVRKLSDLLSLSQNAIQKEFAMVGKHKEEFRKNEKNVAVSKREPRWQLLEEHILSLVFQLKDQAKAIETIEQVLSLEEMPESAVTKILIKLKYRSKQGKVDVSDFISSLGKELIAIADKSYMREMNVDKKISELKRSTYELKLVMLKQKRDKMIKEIRDKELTEQKTMKLNKQISALAKEIQAAISARTR